jgi:hypothetical protein
VQKLFLLFSVFVFFGCATYQSSTKKALESFYEGKYGDAAKDLEGKANEDGKNQVLYLFDRGMALQLSGDYKDSEKTWELADKLTDIKDYISLSTEAATLLTNDSIKQYKGEDFEKVIINALLAIDYVLQNNYEDALVECRRVNQKLYKYKFEAKRDYEQNPFARYLSGLIWEASDHPEDAYIDYKLAAALVPNFPYIKTDVTRLAKKLGRFEDLKVWEKQFGVVTIPTAAEERNMGEVVLLYQQGRVAIKKPRPGAKQFPKFFRRSSDTREARIEAVGENFKEVSHQIYSVSDVAIKTLDDAYAGLIAKRVGGIAAKAILADQVRQKNELLGIVTWIGLNAMDQADLRSWETLPDTLQIARLRLPPGDHNLKVVGLRSGGYPSGEEASFKVNIQAGKKVFLTWRSLR